MVHRFCEEQGVNMQNSYSLSNVYNVAIRKIRCARLKYTTHDNIFEQITLNLTIRLGALQL